MIHIAAAIYLVACALTVVFLTCVIFGAPWGRFTQGGQNPGVLPLGARLAAGVSIIIVASIAASLVSVTGAWPHWPHWAGWVALGIQAASTMLNVITPSKPERLLWGPVTAVMLVYALLIMLGN